MVFPVNHLAGTSKTEPNYNQIQLTIQKKLNNLYKKLQTYTQKTQIKLKPGYVPLTPSGQKTKWVYSTAQDPHGTHIRYFNTLYCEWYNCYILSARLNTWSAFKAIAAAPSAGTASLLDDWQSATHVCCVLGVYHKKTYHHTQPDIARLWLNYTVSQKNIPLYILLSVTSPNVDRFSKFFQLQSQW